MFLRDLTSSRPMNDSFIPRLARRRSGDLGQSRHDAPRRRFDRNEVRDVRRTRRWRRRDHDRAGRPDRGGLPSRAAPPIAWKCDAIDPPGSAVRREIRGQPIFLPRAAMERLYAARSSRTQPHARWSDSQSLYRVGRPACSGIRLHHHRQRPSGGARRFRPPNWASRSWWERGAGWAGVGPPAPSVKTLRRPC